MLTESAQMTRRERESMIMFVLTKNNSVLLVTQHHGEALLHMEAALYIGDIEDFHANIQNIEPRAPSIIKPCAMCYQNSLGDEVTITTVEVDLD